MPPATLPTPGKKAFESIFSSNGVGLGIYRCQHDNIDRGPEQFARSHTINVPIRGVYVKHGRLGNSLVDPQRAVFFSRGDTYETSHPHGCGDGGYYLIVPQRFLDGVLADLDPHRATTDERGFTLQDGPLPAQAAIETRRIARDARTGRSDAFALEERTMEVARSVVAAAYTARGIRKPTRRADSQRRHREIAMTAAAILASRPEKSLSLAEVATQVGASPFHLSRVFHAQHGVTLREYHERTRLQLALNRIQSGERDLTRLAFDSGFTSHSHFTHRFRATFGVTPSWVRTEFASDRATP